MKITVSEGKHNKIHISIDGEYKYTVDAGYWYSCPYHSLTEADGAQAEEFENAVGSRSAFLAGLRILSYSDHSKRDTVSKLIQKGHKKEFALNAADRLEESGYIDDERYAENLAEKLASQKGMSSRGIVNELISKGISKEIASNIAESLDFDPVLRIIELLNGKYSRYLSDDKGRKKTVAALQRLGYSWSDINSAFRRTEIETEDFDGV